MLSMEVEALSRELNLLFISRDFSKNTERSTFYLIEELNKWTNLYCWYEPGDIQDILSKFSKQPDFILLNDIKKTHCPPITGISSISIPLGIIMHDLHYRVKKRKEFIIENQIKHIFSIYRDAFYTRFPEHIDKMNWLPHFVNPSIFKDYGLSKEIDWLIMGNTRKKSYPFRRMMVEMMSSKPGFVFHKHPGYRNIKEEEGNSLYIGRNFSMEINRAKIFLTCNLIYQYPIRKYYEVLASRTLLLAPLCMELLELGFIPGEHFIEINEDNFLQKAEYFLTHEKERAEITDRGYRFVQEFHSVERRAKQLIKMIENILNTQV